MSCDDQEENSSSQSVHVSTNDVETHHFLLMKIKKRVERCEASLSVKEGRRHVSSLVLTERSIDSMHHSCSTLNVISLIVFHAFCNQQRLNLPTAAVLVNQRAVKACSTTQDVHLYWRLVVLLRADNFNYNVKSSLKTVREQACEHCFHIGTYSIYSQMNLKLFEMRISSLI